MEIIIFQLLSCLYLYDSCILVPVHIRKQIRYTGFWPVALRTVPPVYWLLASKGLRLDYWNGRGGSGQAVTVENS